MENLTPCPVDTSSPEFTALYNALKNHEYDYDYEYKPDHFITLQYSESLDEDGESIDADESPDDVDVHIIHFHSGNPDDDDDESDGGALELPANPSNKEIHDAVEFIIQNISME